MSFTHGNRSQPKYAPASHLKKHVAKWVYETIQSITAYDYFEGHDRIEVTKISDLQFQITMKPLDDGPRRYFIVQVKEQM